MVGKSLEGDLASIVKRLDAIIGLILESQFPKKKDLGARIVHSAGLTPTEIARILGKKSATDVSPYLYPKRQKGKK